MLPMVAIFSTAQGDTSGDGFPRGLGADEGGVQGVRSGVGLLRTKNLYRNIRDLSKIHRGFIGVV